MSAPRRLPPEAVYACLVGLAFAAVALGRLDLVLEAARVTRQGLAQGGPARFKLLGEIALFCAILAATWKTVPARPEPRRDAAILVFGALAGYAAEAWGTRLGLWSYYTREAPPLWIVPAWPLGAAFVDRLGRRLRGSAPAVAPAAYWVLAAAALAVVAAFCAPRGGWAWAGPAAAAGCLAAAPRPEEDFWLLAAGLCCVSFADFWGTTNGCWAYWLRPLPLGLWRGIAFGMAFDAALVLGALKAARLGLTAWEAAVPPARPAPRDSSRPASPA